MDRQWRRNEFESVGAPVRSEAPEIFFNFFWVVPLHILALKAQLVFLVSAFVMVSAVWSVSSNHGTPVFCHLEKWGHAPPSGAPWSRRHSEQGRLVLQTGPWLSRLNGLVQQWRNYKLGGTPAQIFKYSPPSLV